MNPHKQILIYGRLGKEPELKYTTKQVPVCQLENDLGQERRYLEVNADKVGYSMEVKE